MTDIDAEAEADDALEGHSPALAGREMLAEETLIVSLSGFMRHTQAPIVTDTGADSAAEARLRPHAQAHTAPLRLEGSGSES